MVFRNKAVYPCIKINVIPQYGSHLKHIVARSYGKEHTSNLWPCLASLKFVSSYSLNETSLYELPGASKFPGIGSRTDKPAVRFEVRDEIRSV